MEDLSVGQLLPILTFIFVASITPGPNNLILPASGMRFGLLQSLPHVGGIYLGFTVLILLAAVGLNQFLVTQPTTMLVLRMLGSTYLFYLAWKLFGFSLNTDEKTQARPLTLWQALAFQFANPKAWLMSTSAMALAIPVTGSANNAAIILLLCWTLVGTTCNCVWILSGMSLSRWLRNDRARRWINGLLASLTIATIALFWRS